jgi:hypothetical protein
VHTPQKPPFAWAGPPPVQTNLQCQLLHKPFNHTPSEAEPAGCQPLIHNLQATITQVRHNSDMTNLSSVGLPAEGLFALPHLPPLGVLALKVQQVVLYSDVHRLQRHIHKHRAYTRLHASNSQHYDSFLQLTESPASYPAQTKAEKITCQYHCGFALEAQTHRFVSWRPSKLTRKSNQPAYGTSQSVSEVVQRRLPEAGSCH